MNRNLKKPPKSKNDNCIITEEIRAKDARNPSDALQTIINNKRDVGFFELNKEFEAKIVKHNLGIIPVRMTSQDKLMAIVYRDRHKALKLYEYAKKYNGYLSDKTPVEAREIGRLLGYAEMDIDHYVNKKYGNIPIRTDDENDYDTIDEQVELPQLKKKKLIKNIQFNKTKDLMKKVI